MEKIKFVWLIILLPVVLVVAGCDGFYTDIELDDITGKWYNQDYEFAFEVSVEGEEYKGYIAENKSHCTVTVTDSTVYFSIGDIVIGSFRCSIYRGVLTMMNRRGSFNTERYSSSLVRSDTIPEDGDIRVELIGKWYSETLSSATPSFEIFSTNHITLSGDETVYDAIISDTTITVLRGTALKGTFQYSIRYGEMFVTNGTGDCDGLPHLAPFVKSNR